ncbi:Zinc finger MYND domain-containing protein 15 [Hypsizygus marmoreus]|uniref:Zinc finger MYND domain-containing protein 15 n=1 Tax=Hypsizygus marmoreus TaxID=39966 RepID=A0A369JXC4_HYPMA|nr:Zinc finger MYND domain-containing protein 15 [Hypsizygus marmoreus]
MHNQSHGTRIAELVQNLRQGTEDDDTLRPICSTCEAFAKPGKKLLQCSGCKAIQYCNTECATRAWNGIVNEQGYMRQPHRDSCKNVQECTLKTPQMQEMAKQFPWARQQADGTFSFTPLRASKELLGSGHEFGWWTEPPCCGTTMAYIWGFLLLEDEHFNEHVGWKLPIRHIPWLDFDFGGSAPPKSFPSFEHNWTNYYEWRGLPMTSLAALLLHWPLSFYKLLDVLGLVPTRPPIKRRHLTVHLVEAEGVLDFLPVFGELALLLPNTDLDIVCFGPAVGRLLEKAKKRPSCLASRSYAYTYTAPKISGGGTVRVALSPHANISMWDITDIAHLRTEKKPDAMVAFNPAIARYNEWKPAVLASRALAIPFAVTEFLERSP